MSPQMQITTAARRLICLPAGSSRLLRPSSVRTPLSCLTPLRKYHGSATRLQPYKDDQDRDSLKPRSNEDGSEKGDAPFDSSKTRPEEEKDAAFSPANKDLSQQKPGENKASDQQKQKSSGGGDPKKK